MIGTEAIARDICGKRIDLCGAFAGVFGFGQRPGFVQCLQDGLAILFPNFLAVMQSGNDGSNGKSGCNIHVESPVLFGDRRMAEAGGVSSPASGGRAA